MINRKRLTSLLAATALAAVAAPANAQSVEELKAQLAALSKRIEQLEKKQKKTPVVKKAEPAPSFGTDDGLFEVNVRGRIYADFGTMSDSDNTMDITGTEFRTARLGVEGKAWKNVKYKIEADFAGNDVTVKDAYLEYKSKNGVAYRAGQFKAPNSLEEQTSSRHTTFMERASFTDAFGFGRAMGVGIGKAGSNYTLKAGLFGAGQDVDASNEGYTIAARATYGQKFDGGTWMVGTSVRLRDAGGTSEFRYRQRPHQHLSDRFVATGRLTDRDTFFGAEGAVQYGEFHVASEYGQLNANGAGSRGQDATFWGGYVEAGWFITGESKPLKLNKGAWDRPKVKSPLHEGGLGAWQLAVRYDTIDLTGDGIYGGEQDTFVLGLNWYINRHSRIMLNYNHSNISRAFDVSANGEDGKNDVDALGLRFQIDW